jgi:hypothetical protein
MRDFASPDCSSLLLLPFGTPRTLFRLSGTDIAEEIATRCHQSRRAQIQNLSPTVAKAMFRKSPQEIYIDWNDLRLIFESKEAVTRQCWDKKKRQ